VHAVGWCNDSIRDTSYLSLTQVLGRLRGAALLKVEAGDVGRSPVRVNRRECCSGRSRRLAEFAHSLRHHLASAKALHDIVGHDIVAEQRTPTRSASATVVYASRPSTAIGNDARSQVAVLFRMVRFSVERNPAPTVAAASIEREYHRPEISSVLLLLSLFRSNLRRCSPAQPYGGIFHSSHEHSPPLPGEL